MKKIILFAISVLLGASLIAQSDVETKYNRTPSGETQTLFGSPGHVGWYVGPDFAFSQFDGRDVFLMGISSGVIFNHNFSLGLAGYGIMNTNNLRYTGISEFGDLYLYGGYGGLKLEYRFFSKSPVNLAVPLLVGGGGLVYSRNNWADDNDHEFDDDIYASDGFFVVEPGVMVGLNFFKFMRVDLGVTYRYTPNMNLPSTDKGLINSFNAVASLRFGNL